ncbi:MAG: carbohydrate kinase family protein [Patescibacteria group bacterium]
MATSRKKPGLDMIAIGESQRDIFYQIHEASVSCSIHRERCLLCLEYAEKIPVEHVVKVPAAGNSANAAVGASRLGLKTALVSWMGTDNAGKHLKEALACEKVGLQFLMIDTQHPTSEATNITFQGERTQLVYFQPRKHSLPKLSATRCIYYSAMGAKHDAFDAMLKKELKRHPNALFAFQPGTTHIRQGLDVLKVFITRSDLFILNKDEAHLLLADGDRTVCNMLERFGNHGAKNVIITDGKNGADGWDGKTHWHMPIFDGEAKERTGAGDSFACGATVALLEGLDLPTALRYGTANSWSVVQQVGPQKGLLTGREMQRVLRKFSKIKPTIHKHD